MNHRRAFRPHVLALAAIAAVSTVAAQAAPELIAIGSLSGASTDLSGQTGLMENGVPGNILGGIGSGLTWAGGTTFLALPDRGANANIYNDALDSTASYVNRFDTMTLALSASAPGSALPFAMTPTLQSTTLLYSTTPLYYGSGAGLGNTAPAAGGTPIGSGAPAINTADKYYFTGRSDNFNPATTSTDPNNARLDPESIRVSNDGKSVFISDEYGPYIYQFDRASGARIQSFALPSNLAISHESPQVNNEIGNNTSGRTANKGMEGLAITPDGKTLVGVMQANLLQDSKGSLRIVTVDVASGATHEYAYQLTDGAGVSDIVAVDATHFLVDERDGNGLGGGAGAETAQHKTVYEIDVTGATDIANVASLSKDPTQDGIKPVAKKALIDVVGTLEAGGITPDKIPSKLEGLSFGEDVMVDGVLTHTLYLGNDNDFLATDPETGFDNPNKWFVFGVTDADLGTAYVPQEFAAAVPEPETYALMLGGLGLMGFVAKRRQRGTRG
jgi:hypothetical protein